MAENKMEQVAKLLGLELGEKFKITYRGDNNYVFTKEGFFGVRPDGMYLLANPDFVLNLLIGKMEVIKIPKPILNEDEKEYLKLY